MWCKKTEHVRSYFKSRKQMLLIAEAPLTPHPPKTHTKAPPALSSNQMLFVFYCLYLSHLHLQFWHLADAFQSDLQCVEQKKLRFLITKLQATNSE